MLLCEADCLERSVDRQHSLYSKISRPASSVLLKVETDIRTAGAGRSVKLATYMVISDSGYDGILFDDSTCFVVEGKGDADAILRAQSSSADQLESAAAYRQIVHEDLIKYAGSGICASSIQLGLLAVMFSELYLYLVGLATRTQDIPNFFPAYELLCSFLLISVAKRAT